MAKEEEDWMREFATIVLEISANETSSDRRKDWIDNIFLIQKAKVVAQELIRIGRRDEMEKLWDSAAPKIMPRPLSRNNKDD